MGLAERMLRWVFPHKEIGWTEIGEEFTRFTLLRTPWFRIYLHKLYAPNPHPHTHDHPWGFVALLLRGGYWEYADGRWEWRRPWSVLRRPAEYRHNVVTRGVSWSVIITGRKYREWGLKEECHLPPPDAAAPLET